MLEALGMQLDKPQFQCGNGIFPMKSLKFQIRLGLEDSLLVRVLELKYFKKEMKGVIQNFKDSIRIISVYISQSQFVQSVKFLPEPSLA